MRRRFASEDGRNPGTGLDTRYLDYINTVTAVMLPHSSMMYVKQYHRICQKVQGCIHRSGLYQQRSDRFFIPLHASPAKRRAAAVIHAGSRPEHLSSPAKTADFHEFRAAGNPPNFNQYFGASLHAHVSTLFVCQKTVAQEPNESSFLHFSPFIRRDPYHRGIYECTLCDTIYKVGPGEEYITVQELKEAGCHECGNTFFVV